MRRDGIADADALRQPEHALADVFDRRSVFRLHRDEAVCDHRPEKKRDARAFC